MNHCASPSSARPVGVLFLAALFAVACSSSSGGTDGSAGAAGSGGGVPGAGGASVGGGASNAGGATSGGGTTSMGGATGGTTSTGGATSGGGNGAGGQPGVGGGTQGDPEPPAQTGMTAAHNASRASVTPAASPPIPPLSWSASVATTAQAWADKCAFKHSGGNYGENIYATAGTSSTPEEVVGSWVSEAASYDYATNTCTKVCGHYTQVVWRDSVSLGCGVADCTTNSPFSGFPSWQFWVCNYDPPGNYVGKKPY